MRPRRLLLRLPAPVAGRGRPGPIVLALLVGLASPLGSSASVAPADPGPVAGPRVAPAAGLPPPPGTTSLVSRRFGGGFPSGPSAQDAISANGRFVAFASRAADLVTGDTNGVADVFVLDRQTGTMSRAPAPGGGPILPGDAALDPSISADGNVVAYTWTTRLPLATAVVQTTYVVAWDRKKKTAEVVSLTAAGQRAPLSSEGTVSANGRFVAFSSTVPGIAPTDTNNVADVFVRDRTAGTTRLVSADPTGAAGDGGSTAPAISDDGNLIAFQSDADNLIDGFKNGFTDVFVRDVAAGRTEAISVALAGLPSGDSEAPAISADGAFVAFESIAPNLVAGDVIRTPDVFRRDRAAGLTTLVSIGLDGLANGPSGQAAISDDGRIVAFASSATNLIEPPGPLPPPVGTTQGLSEIYARDVTAEVTILISVSLTGGFGGGQNVTPAIGGNGRFIAFASTSAILVDNDRNRLSDIFLRDLPPRPALNPKALDFGTRAVGVPSAPIAAILTNAGWGPLTGGGSKTSGGAAADYEIVFDGCVGVALHRGEACTVAVTFTATKAGSRTTTLQVLDDFTGSPRTARLVGAGSLAKLELKPEVGPPGIVTIATGSGFPPNTAVTLHWDPGITPKLATVTSDAKGAFRVQVLIFHNDRVGLRDLLASPSDGVAFPEFGARFLVVQGANQPPGFAPIPNSGYPPPTLIFRN